MGHVVQIGISVHKHAEIELSSRKWQMCSKKADNSTPQLTCGFVHEKNIFTPIIVYFLQVA